ncbi:MAG TPA: FtsB family cell division protein [Candidatus Brocadiia bacterium]|nr:septum formation initiator family protein [Candidatus Brocadiales bacterium]
MEETINEGKFATSNQHQARPVSLLPIFITVCIGVALIAFLSYQILKKHKERNALLAVQKELEEQVTHLKKRNLWLRKEKDALLSDPVRIEKEARTQLGYTRAEEIPYEKHKFNIKE